MELAPILFTKTNFEFKLTQHIILYSDNQLELWNRNMAILLLQSLHLFDIVTKQIVLLDTY